MKENMLGSYGEWAVGRRRGLPRLSFRRSKFKAVGSWRRRARGRMRELLAQPDERRPVKAELRKSYEYDGLRIEELTWQLPYGPATEAVFMKPAGAEGKLPGVLALHDHGGRKYFGKRKIVRLPGRRHPLIVEHQREHYGDVGWANELARRGYAVLVHDGFPFGSRRIRYADVPEVIRGGRRDGKPERSREVLAYNEWASEQESVVAKSLFCAGTTWPGVFLNDDQRALDYLCSRRDVDGERVGCGGLSGGGMRTVFLAGMDERIRAAVCAGFMTTWEDFALNKSYTHTWMTYLPLAPEDLEFPEILGLRMPLPTLVLNCENDPLYTLEGMHEADRILRQVYAKGKAIDKYRASFYPGGHKFDLEMQAEAFSWWDQWLRRG